jgi:hypothetical protein
MQKTNTFLYLLFAIIIIAFVGTTIYVKYHKGNSSNKTHDRVEEIKRKLEYTNSKNQYIIEQEDKNFYVTIYANTNCAEETNCVNNKINEYKVTDEQQKNDLYEMFDKLFEKAKENKLSLTQDDLNLDQITLIESLYKEEEIADPVEYTIGRTGSNGGNSKTGYTYELVDDKYVFTISMGEKSTGGYAINIQKVIVTGGEVTVIVKETTPAPNSMTTQAFTTPFAQISFNRMPNKITIVNAEGTINYQEIKNTPTEEEPKEPAGYRIIGSSNDSNYKTKGYIINNENGKTILTIAMGERNTGGYAIKVNNIKVNGDSVTITIEEITPGRGDTVTQAFTYPIAKVELEKVPTKLTVISKTTNTTYQEIKK